MKRRLINFTFNINIIKIIIILFVLSASLIYGQDSTGSVIDIDGNVYKTVKIGNQWWMAENLKVTHYQNGDEIPNVLNMNDWIKLKSGAYCVYKNNESYGSNYGYLYNWYSVNDTRNIAPQGWHVPTDIEWKELEMYIGMSQQATDSTNWRGSNEGNKLKATGMKHWKNPNTSATNEISFYALPGGRRGFGTVGAFSSEGYGAYFWCSTENSSKHDWYRALYNNEPGICRQYKRALRYYGFSIRCVKNTDTSLDIGNENDHTTTTIKKNIQETSTVTDIDGNVYKTVKIGDQWWMAENLKVTHYRNGDPIPNVISNNKWKKLKKGAYCNYHNDSSYVITYGRLYNWYTVNDSRHIAPEGWHVPSDEEWQTLIDYLGGFIKGGMLKETSLRHWEDPNTGATNESGFSVRPGGDRYYVDGSFSSMGKCALFWTSTECNRPSAWYRLLRWEDSKIIKSNFLNKQSGFSIRCIKD